MIEKQKNLLRELHSTPTEKLGKAGRFLVFQVKLWPHCFALLGKNKAFQQAAALSYHTILGIVPLAIVALLIFQTFPTYSEIGEQVKSFAYEQMQLANIRYPSPTEPGKTIMVTDQLDIIVNNFFSGAGEGSIAFVSIIIIIWAAITLLLTIEKAFNNIWHVTRARGFLHRVINYWALLTLGPLLMGLGVYVTTKFAILGRLQDTLLHHFAPFISYIIATIAFFLLYFVMPNTKVSARAAAWGAGLAAIIWSIAKWVFGLYVTQLVPYSKVYGVVGLIPLTVLWVYITWIIVLFGLQLTFTTQNLKSLDRSHIEESRRRAEQFIANDITAINIVREIAEAFQKNSAPVEPERIQSKLALPGELADRLFSLLIKNGIIARTSEPKVGFIPVKDPSNISLAEIGRTVAQAAFAQSVMDQPQIVYDIAKIQQETLAKYNLRQTLSDKNNPTATPEPQPDINIEPDTPEQKV